MVRVGTLADPEEFDRGRRSGQQEDRRRFADTDAVTVTAEGIAQSAGNRFERSEAAECHPAQRIRSAYNGGIGEASAYEPAGRSESFAARRAGRGHRIGRPGEAQRSRDEFAEISSFLLAIMEASGPNAVLPNGSIGRLALGCPGRAGSQHD